MQVLQICMVLCSQLKACLSSLFLLRSAVRAVFISILCCNNIHFGVSGRFEANEIHVGFQLPWVWIIIAMLFLPLPSISIHGLVHDMFWRKPAFLPVFSYPGQFVLENTLSLWSSVRPIFLVGLNELSVNCQDWRRCLELKDYPLQQPTKSSAKINRLSLGLPW